MSRNDLCVILMLATCGHAFWRGGAPERLTAAAFLVASALTTVLVASWPTRFRSTEFGILIVDFLLLGALLLLAVRANRFWPIGVAGIQLIGIGGHFASMLLPHLSPRIYGLTTALGTYPMMLFLVIGTRNHRARLRTRGEDRSWVVSSRRSTRSMRSAGLAS